MASSRRDAAPATPERLQKVLAAAGLASRREAEEWIRSGRVTVNGAVATLGQRVVPRDEIGIDGRPVRARRVAAAATTPVAFLLHRSPGEALADGLLERLPKRAGRRFLAISPMPRIDGGLELATADGALAERLQRHIHSLESEFSARVRGEILPERVEQAKLGELDDGSRIEVLALEAGESDETASNRWYRLVVRGASGKQVRQLLERQGAVVSRVLRVAFGPVKLTRDLARGRFRPLTAGEIGALLGEAAPVVADEDRDPPAKTRSVSPGSRTRGPSRRVRRR